MYLYMFVKQHLEYECLVDSPKRLQNVVPSSDFPIIAFLFFLILLWLSDSVHNILLGHRRCHPNKFPLYLHLESCVSEASNQEQVLN